MEYTKFASASASTSSASTASQTLTETRLKGMLKDPAKNATSVSSFSSTMKATNGIYRQILRYESSMLTFDHVIYPVMENPYQFTEDPSAYQLSFSQNAILIDRLNPRFHLPIFTDKLMTKGVTYQYKSEDKKSVAYQEFPNTLCRISYIEDGVHRFQIDLSKLSEVLVLTYPKEIQSAFTSYQNGGTGDLADGSWYQVSDKGVAFTIDTEVLNQGGLASPPLASMLLDAIRYETAKDNMENVADLDNAKIVHSKIETDDKGIPLMELPVVNEYHNALKRTLPKGAVAITNPFETTSVTLSGTGNDGKFALLDKSSDQLYKSAGISPQLFADDNNSSQALERSIQVDIQFLNSFLLPMYANYYNYELTKANKKGSTWKIKFLHSSYFKRDEAIKTAKDQLTYGGSRMEYLAYTGMTPLEIANMMTFEQKILNIDEYMVAKQTSNTLSGDGEEKEVGAPKSDNPTDTTIRINDSQ